MADLPSWDELDYRLVSANPKVATIVMRGLRDRDDTEKRMVLDIINTLTDAGKTTADESEAWKVARIAAFRFEQSIARGDLRDLRGHQAQEVLVDIIGNTVSAMWDRWVLEHSK